jgi:hypothetical protein
MGNLWIQYFFNSNSFSVSISTNGGDQICLLWMIDSWKGSKNETWNIEWIFINLESCNQNAIQNLFG